MMTRSGTAWRAATALTAGLLGLIALVPSAPAGEKRLADDEVADWVQKRVQDWQPTAEDRRFDEIGWARDLREAERLARDHNRPVFLFTHDGHIAVGRC
jgi:exoribonuclease II